MKKPYKSLHAIHSALIELASEFAGLSYMIKTHKPDVASVEDLDKFYEGFGNVLIKKTNRLNRVADDLDRYSIQIFKIEKIFKRNTKRLGKSRER